jgi:hypothetical protein
MPCLEMLRAVTDINISSDAARKRVEAFNIANELIVEADISILIPSQMFERISTRLNDDHKAAFQTLYRIDNSTRDAVPKFDLHQAIKLLADAESKARPIIILTDSCSDYSSFANSRIKIISSEEFIKRVNLVRYWKKKGILSSFDDALGIILFR